ncbi:MAG: STAS/SEC14 domain-containing protein [Pseudohongiellaceae bacterium]
MIVELAESEANHFGFEITSKVTLEEQHQWIVKIESALNQYDELNILLVLNEGASWGVDAGIEDIKWVLRHMKSIRKIAIVSSSKVWKWLVSIDSFFASMVGIQEKHFDLAELSVAWDWIKHAEKTG